MEILQFEFIRNSLIAAVLVNVACGIVGSYIVIKRITFISGGISHTAFGGVGLGHLLGINPVLTALPFSVLAGILIGILSKKTKVNEDTAIGMLWVVGMALGIIFINLTTGYAPDLFGYLFGSILTVTPFDLYMMLCLNLVIILMTVLFFREFLFICFDEEFSTVVGVPATILYFALLCLISLSVVILIRVVGVILVIGLLTIPAVISRGFTHNIKKLMLLSIVIGISLTVGGLFLSYMVDLACGPTIILVLGGAFLVSLLFRRIKVLREGHVPKKVKKNG